MDGEGLATLGDAVLRLSARAPLRLSDATHLHLDVSGSEANVACNLARLGHRTRWCGCLPRTKLGKRVTLPMRSASVDISTLVWRDEGRVSTYYVQHAAPPSAEFVIYDRKNSCFEGLRPSEVDWDKLLSGAAFFHATGITASLCANTLELVRTGLAEAKNRGIKTSFDVNYRELLWGTDEARDTIAGLFSKIDLLLCSARDAKRVFGITGKDAAKQLAEMSGALWVVVSDVDSNVSGYASADGGEILQAPFYPTIVLDRVGAGDGLASGVIHGLLNDDFEKGLRYGAAFAALVLSVSGEQPDTDAGELEQIVSGKTGDIIR